MSTRTTGEPMTSASAVTPSSDDSDETLSCTSSTSSLIYDGRTRSFVPKLRRGSNEKKDEDIPALAFLRRAEPTLPRRSKRKSSGKKGKSGDRYDDDNLFLDVDSVMKANKNRKRTLDDISSIRTSSTLSSEAISSDEVSGTNVASNQDGSFDRDTKKALKASLETFKQESSTRQMILSSHSQCPPYKKPSRPLPFDLNEFTSLWSYCEDSLGLTTAQIEQGSMVRGANHNNKTSASTSSEKQSTFSSSQSSAQYGRILFPTMQKIIHMTNLKPEEIFLDIGHGIGNATLQAAFTIGCESRGIEIVPERCRIAEQFRDILLESVDIVANEEHGRRRKLGKIEFREGCLKDPEHRQFISESDVVFVNNAHEIFGARSVADTGSATLDTHVGSLFALMKPGARMVTLHPILCLGRSLTEENAKRRRLGLQESIDASFFLCEKHSLGIDAVNWTYKEVWVYLYTRVHQSNSTGDAVFLCSNKKCCFKGCPTAALSQDGLIQDDCVYCGKKRIVRTRN